MRSEGVNEVLDYISTRQSWTIVLNETPRDIVDTLSTFPHITLFRDACQGRTAVITNISGWKTEFSPKDAEILMLRDSLNNQNINLFAVYLQPQTVMAKLKEILNAIHKKLKNTITQLISLWVM